MSQPAPRPAAPASFPGDARSALPSCADTASLVSPPNRECTRPPVPMTSANRISPGLGASWMPISMLLKWLRT